MIVWKVIKPYYFLLIGFDRKEQHHVHTFKLS